MNNIYFIIIALLCMFYIIREVRKGKLQIKESFWWFIASIVMLFLAIFPYSIDFIAKIFNVEYPPALLLVFCIIFLVLMNFRVSKIEAEQEKKIVELEQNLAILKEKINEKK